MSSPLFFSCFSFLFLIYYYKAPTGSFSLLEKNKIKKKPSNQFLCSICEESEDENVLIESELRKQETGRPQAAPQDASGP